MAFYSTHQEGDGLAVNVDVIQWLRDQAERLSGSDPDWVGPLESPRSAFNRLVDEIADKLGGPGSFKIGPFTLPPLLPAPTAEPPSPEQVLQQIVAGINAAESRLNTQNFVIAAGSVEAKLELPVAGVTIMLSIAPKPYS